MDTSAPTKKFETLGTGAEVSWTLGTTITFYDEKSNYVNFIPFR